MLKSKNKQKVVFGVSLLLVMVMVMGMFHPLQAVTSEECMDAFEECLEDYGNLPFPADAYGTLYCATGLSFCVLYM